MSYSELHAPIIPALSALLQAYQPQSPRPLVLDLASGPGEKVDLIQGAYGAGARILALDDDRAALRGVAGGAHALAGDAHALPLADACVDAVVCIAALGLLAQPGLAAREMRRVLRPGGAALVVTAERRWGALTRWPGAMAGHLGAALPPASADHAAPAEALAQAGGFARHHAYALALGAEWDPQRAALALLGWGEIAALLRSPLPPELAGECAMAHQEAEIELCDVLLGTWLFR